MQKIIKQKRLRRSFVTLLILVCGLGIAVTSVYMGYRQNMHLDLPAKSQTSTLKQPETEPDSTVAAATIVNDWDQLDQQPETQTSTTKQPETESDSTAAAPTIVNDWNLILVNKWYAIPDGYKVTLTTLRNGQAVDERCYPDLQEMMDDCRAAGLSPLICSSYRSQAKQEKLFNNGVKKYLAQGYSEEEAENEAWKYYAIPGTSEHQLGLAVDIVDVNNQNLNSSQEKTEVQQWLMKNSWKYGFILRYPSDKNSITGISYEPWHYRYVGKEAATAIYEQSICLEEYLQKMP